jgi:hypothetical protein
MKRRSRRAPVKSTQKQIKKQIKRGVKEVTFLKSQDLIDAARRTGGLKLAPEDGLRLYDADGNELDCSTQPRATTCGICGSTEVVNYATIVAAQHPTDDELMLAIVLGVCRPCEELGPDVFLPEMARRLQEEVQA